MSQYGNKKDWSTPLLRLNQGDIAAKDGFGLSQNFLKTRVHLP
jgi:hypothetical protein